LRLTRCIQCGSRSITLQPVRVRLTTGQSVTVEASVCPACWETYFDEAAMEQIEAVRFGPRHRRRHT
jgi:hypothetical protein